MRCASGLCAVHPVTWTPHSRTDGARSRNLDGAPAGSAAKLCAWLDGILRSGSPAMTVRSARPVASPPYSRLLLEKMASAGNARLSGRTASSADPPRPQSQGPLAHGQHQCQRRRNDQRVVAGSGAPEPQVSPGIACPKSLNRRMRTPCPAVWAGRPKWAPYPILLRFFNPGSFPCLRNRSICHMTCSLDILRPDFLLNCLTSVASCCGCNSS